MTDTHLTEHSVINPEKYFTYCILLDGKNIFTCNEKLNALFHLKDLVENKYLAEIRKEYPDREVYIEPNETQTKFRILRKTHGIFRSSAVIECATLMLECVPAIRRIDTNFFREKIPTLKP